MSDFLLNTDYNNQKILANGFVTLNIGSPNFGDTFTLAHNLGYIPAARVWYEPKPGQWMPLSVRQYTQGTPFDYYEITGQFYLTTTDLVVNIRNAGIASTVRVWLRVYLDD